MFQNLVFVESIVVIKELGPKTLLFGHVFRIDAVRIAARHFHEKACNHAEIDLIDELADAISVSVVVEGWVPIFHECTHPMHTFRLSIKLIERFVGSNGLNRGHFP